MSELKTNKISPATLTDVVLGDSGDTFTIPSGATITNSGTATGFGKVVQVVNVQSGAVATGTGTISRDASIPQITEGDEYITLAVTPTNASNKLLVQAILLLGNSATVGITACLFNTDNDSSNALAGMTQINGSGDWELCLVINYLVVAGTTSATTFRIRAGGSSAGTTTFNGVGAAVLHGAAIKSSITITEISA